MIRQNILAAAMVKKKQVCDGDGGGGEYTPYTQTCLCANITYIGIKANGYRISIVILGVCTMRVREEASVLQCCPLAG